MHPSAAWSAIRSRAFPLGLSVLVASFAVLCLHAAAVQSLCNDEAKHILTGWWLLTTGQCCLGGDNSPLTGWLAVPSLVLGMQSLPGLGPDVWIHEAAHDWLFRAARPERILFASRCMTILVGIAMLVAAALFIRRRYGVAASLLAGSMLAFDPTLLAHFSLASTDALLTAAAVFFMLALQRWIERPGLALAAAAGLALGLALVAKFTAVVLVPATAVAIVVSLRRLPARRGRDWVGDGLAFVTAAVIVVWAGYGAHLVQSPPFIDFPGLLQGFRLARGYAHDGMVAFYRGEIGSYWPSYFFIVPLVKTPLPLLAMWLGAAATILAGGVWRDSRIQSILATAGLFYAAVVASRLCIGVRHMLPVYPLMALATGMAWHSAAGLPPRWRQAAGIGLAACVSWLAVEAVRSSPGHLAYFNQAAGGPRGGVAYLGDSNLDWGQDLGKLPGIMAQYGLDEVILSYVGNTDPAFYGIRYQYLPKMLYPRHPGGHVVDSRREVLAISVNNLQGPFLRDESSYWWLFERKPFARAGDSIYLFDITGDAGAHLRLATVYDLYGLHELAAAERAKAAVLREMQR